MGRGDHIELPDLTGRTILVTGASSGIGRAAALRLAAAGATVLAHGRSAHRLGELARHLGTEPLRADFARLQDVRGLARQVIQRTGRLDAILHNAGTYHKSRVLTEDGHESTFQTNYLAPFLLQSLLQGLLAGTPGSRVVVTTSVASHIGKVVLDDLDYARRTYRGFCAYADTKLMNILFVAELRRRLATFGPSIATAVHPGAVASSFGRGSLLPRFLYRVPIRKELLIGYFVHTPEGARSRSCGTSREATGRCRPTASTSGASAVRDPLHRRGATPIWPESCGSVPRSWSSRGWSRERGLWRLA